MDKPEKEDHKSPGKDIAPPEDENSNPPAIEDENSNPPIIEANPTPVRGAENTRSGPEVPTASASGVSGQPGTSSERTGSGGGSQLILKNPLLGKMLFPDGVGAAARPIEMAAKKRKISPNDEDSDYNQDSPENEDFEFVEDESEDEDMQDDSPRPVRFEGSPPQPESDDESLIRRV